MFRRLWQAFMIYFARSKKCKTFMQNNYSTSKLAQQYIGGSCPISAAQKAESLHITSINSSLFYLGEYVDSQEKVDENINAKVAVIQELAKKNLDIHISIDPTQVGCTLNWDRGASNIQKIAQTIAKSSKDKDRVHCLMLDMEDFSINKKTITLYDQLHQQGLPVALTLQAYLKKTYHDMEQKILQGAKVRLVKGAFAAGEKLAFKKQHEIKSNYRRLIDLMLSQKAKQTGFYPIFATHDHTLHTYAIQRARENGWKLGTYEFEMLYGARDDVAKQLAAQGERIRLYLPFGKDWWPYAIRRIGENPRGLPLLLRSVLQNT